MIDNLGLLRARTETRLAGASTFIEGLPSGRGGEWKALLAHTLEQFERAVAAAESDLALAEGLQPAPAAALRQNVVQRLERMQFSLDTLHHQMATYREAVARSDVPVGLQHLIDVLMQQIVIESGDPIVHLDANNMYSTIDLVNPMRELVGALVPAGDPFDGPHPIAFNLPALDPNNALLAPVLAHEVAHTAVTRDLLSKFHAKVFAEPYLSKINAAQAEMDAKSPSKQLPEIARTLFGWSSELLCDAIAIALCGPSFLLAFTAFVPPTSSVPATTHPDVQDRIRYALGLLDHLGWRSAAEERAPGLLAWIRDVASQPALTGTPEEEFLRRTLDITEEVRAEIAIEHVADFVLSSDALSDIDSASSWLAQGVPLIDAGDGPLTPWQVVLAGWLGALEVHGDEPRTIALAAGDRDYNSVIVKALEYSQIVSEWSEE